MYRFVTKAGDGAIVFSPYRRIHVCKVANPLTKTGFDRLVSDLSAKLVRGAGMITQQEMRSIYRSLGVDWATATDRKVLRLTDAIDRAMKRAGRRVVTRIASGLKDTGGTVARETRRQVVKEHKLGISSSLSSADLRAVERVAADQGAFVTDFHGRVSESMSEKARSIVASGLERGFQNDRIAKDLESGLRSSLVGRQSSYYQVVANAFVNRARSFSALRSFADAGIERYIISAVLDEVTTDTCRGLDGKVFEVAAGIDLYSAVDDLEDPKDVKYTQPWIVEKEISRGPDAGKTGLYIPRKSGGSLLAGVVEKSGVGSRDARGSFTFRMSDKRLQGAGIGPPPYHGRCRTTLLPDI